MKIFVTVGSTRFCSLVEAVDRYLSNDLYNVTIQLADGLYKPQNHRYITFTEDVERYYDEADLVITHAGAGTVFRLLELNKKVVVVPNFERIDDHQSDIADYMSLNGFTGVCHDLSKIEESVIETNTKSLNTYSNELFSGFSLIDSLFAGEGEFDTSKVAGIPIDTFQNIEQLSQFIIDANGGVKAGSAIAINPEKIVKSIQNEQVKKILLDATIRYPDGIGVVRTLNRKTKKAISRIPGCELWEVLMERAASFKLPVFLVGAKPEVIAKTKDKLEQEFQANIVGIRDGYFNEQEEQGIIDEIVRLQPKLVSVALGSPRQELFIEKCMKLCPDTYFMGVGGTYDVYTGTIKRAPEVYRKLNLEWFYRVANEPRRILRHGNLVKYLYLELTHQL